MNNKEGTSQSFLQHLLLRKDEVKSDRSMDASDNYVSLAKMSCSTLIPEAIELTWH